MHEFQPNTKPFSTSVVRGDAPECSLNELLEQRKLDLEVEICGIRDGWLNNLLRATDTAKDIDDLKPILVGIITWLRTYSTAE